MSGWYQDGVAWRPDCWFHLKYALLAHSAWEKSILNLRKRNRKYIAKTPKSFYSRCSNNQKRQNGLIKTDKSYRNTEISFHSLSLSMKIMLYCKTCVSTLHVAPELTWKAGMIKYLFTFSLLVCSFLWIGLQSWYLDMHENNVN